MEAYDIFSRLNSNVQNVLFERTFNSLQAYMVPGIEHDIILACLIKRYTKRKKIELEMIEKYASNFSGRDLADLMLLAGCIYELPKEQFNSIFKIAVNKLAEGVKVRTVLCVKLLINGDIELLNDNIVSAIKPGEQIINAIIRMVPNYTVVCEACGERKSLTEFKPGYTSCKTCCSKTCGTKRRVKTAQIKEDTILACLSLNNRLAE